MSYNSNKEVDTLFIEIELQTAEIVTQHSVKIINLKIVLFLN